MANGKNTPYGLKPVFSKLGGSWTEKLNVYLIDAPADGVATYAGQIYTSDPVVWGAAGGVIEKYPFDKDGSQGGANIKPTIGTFWGCEYTLPTGELVKSSYWPGGVVVQAGSKIKAYVLDDPYTVYSIQVSTYDNTILSTIFEPKYIGSNFGFGLGNGDAQNVVTNPAAGNAKTGQSAVYLAYKFASNNIVHTTDTLPLKVYGFELNPQIDPTQSYASVLVTINNHVDKAGTLGALV